MKGNKDTPCRHGTKPRVMGDEHSDSLGSTGKSDPEILARLSSCETCRMEDGIRQLMQKDSCTASDELRRKRRIADAISTARLEEADARYRGENEPGPATHRRRSSGGIRPWQTVLWAATLLTGIGLGGIIFSSGKLVSTINSVVARAPQKSVSSEQNSPQGKLEGKKDGSWRSSGVPAISGVAAPDTGSQIALAAGVDVLLDSDARMTVQQSTDALLRVSLTRGRLLAAVNPAVLHPRMEVVTADGVVVVKGTVFSVSVSDNIEVTVLRGAVEVLHSSGKDKAKVVEGMELTLGSGVVRTVSAAEISMLADDAARLGVKLSSQDARAAEPSSNASHAGGPDSDGEQRGRKPGKAEINKLLSDARARKHRGDWNGALEKYEAVIALSPASSAAATARIAAGNIRLRLGDAQMALAHFSAYLSGASADLQQEAMFGKIKALRQLGDLENELAVSRQFLARWPNTVHADSIKDKIFHLEILTGIPAKATKNN